MQSSINKIYYLRVHLTMQLNSMSNLQFNFFSYFLLLYNFEIRFLIFNLYFFFKRIIILKNLIYDKI